MLIYSLHDGYVSYDLLYLVSLLLRQEAVKIPMIRFNQMKVLTEEKCISVYSLHSRILYKLDMHLTFFSQALGSGIDRVGIIWLKQGEILQSGL